MAKIILILSLLAVAIVVLSVPIEGQGNDIQVDTKVAPQGLLKRIKLFDFNRFTTTFGRKYKNVIERAMRQAVYLANTVKIFVHNILYSKRQSDYYLAVTPLADKTEAELHALYPDANDNSFVDSVKNYQAPVDKTEAVDEATLERELVQVIEKHEPGHEFIEEALKASETSRTKRSTEHEEFVLSDENPKLQVPMTMTMSRDDQTVAPVPDQDKTWIGSFMANSAEWVHEQFASLQSPQSKVEEHRDVHEPSSPKNIPFIHRGVGGAHLDIHKEKEQEMYRGDLNDAAKPTVHFDSLVNQYSMDDFVRIMMGEVPLGKKGVKSYETTIDWRTSECISPIRDQDNCGACWAFTTVAMLEYEHCRQQKTLVPLSEQYYIDCGLVYHSSMFGLNGCDGGHIMNSFFLVNHYGAMLQVDHPYQGTHGTCPYGSDPNQTPTEKMGRFRPLVVLNNFYQRTDGHQKIDQLLEKGPVPISINTAPDFQLYGGGVHSGADCKPGKSAHAMLAVGSGVENGVEFWIIRNSHSTIWGEEGYYRLSKNVDPLCVIAVLDWTVNYRS